MAVLGSRKYFLGIPQSHVSHNKILDGYIVHAFTRSPLGNISQETLCGLEVIPGWTSLGYSFIVENDPAMCRRCKQGLFIPVSNTGVKS